MLLKLISWLKPLIVIAFSLFGKSLRIHMLGVGPYPSCVYLFWHNYSFPLIYLARHGKIATLVSHHRDGELMSKLLLSLGFGVARGSSTYGGIAGAKTLLRFLEDNYSLALTPDGPKGPPKYFKETLYHFLHLVKKPIILIGIGYTRKITFASWDRYQIPYPFSRVLVLTRGPYEITNLAREQLEDMLQEVTREANSLAEKD